MQWRYFNDYRVAQYKLIVMKSGRIVEYEDTEIIMNYPKQEYTKQLISAVPVLRRECADEYNIRA